MFGFCGERGIFVFGLQGISAGNANLIGKIKKFTQYDFTEILSFSSIHCPSFNCNCLTQTADLFELKLPFS
jgi:hypothetical protein